MPRRNLGGRPKKKLSPMQIENLAAIMCTTAEIAAVLHVSKDTIERNYSESLVIGRERAKESLRRSQFKAALKGNPTMLIWLGKQYLGQTDKLPDFSKLTDEELLAIVSGTAAGAAALRGTAAGEAGDREEDEPN